MSTLVTPSTLSTFMRTSSKIKSAAGAVRSGKSHIDSHVTVIVNVDFINQSEFVNVHRYFRVIDRLEHSDNAFFYLQFAVCIHIGTKIVQTEYKTKMLVFFVLLR